MPRTLLFAAGVLLVLLSQTEAAPPPPAAPEAAYPSPIIEKLQPPVVIRERADSFDALVARLKPTFVWGGRDMVWVVQGPDNRPTFKVDRAYVYAPPGGQRRWVVLSNHVDDNFRGGHPMAGEYFGADLPLHDKLTGGDGGPDDQTIVLSKDAKAGTLYMLYWNSIGPAGNGLYQDWRHPLLLQTPAGAWRFVGEAPTEGQSHWGGESAELTVHWTGQEQSPLRIELTLGSSQSEAREEDEPATVLTERHGVMEGSLPLKPVIEEAATLYVIAGEDDSLKMLGERMHLRDSSRDAKSWSNYLAKLNPRVPAEHIELGTRLILERHEAAPATQPSP